jgi:hypothetical protein
MLRIADQEIIDGDVQCGSEGVQVSVHDESPRLERAVATPILDTLTYKSQQPHQ